MGYGEIILFGWALRSKDLLPGHLAISVLKIDRMLLAILRANKEVFSLRLLKDHHLVFCAAIVHLRAIPVGCHSAILAFTLISEWLSTFKVDTALGAISHQMKVHATVMHRSKIGSSGA